VDFDLTREQEMIRKEVRKFAQSEIAPVALELDEAEEFSSDLTRKMGEIGLFGMFVSEKYDGQAMDYISYIIAVEEIARVDGSQAATIAAGNSLGIGPLYYFGNEEQKKNTCPTVQRGGVVGFRAHRTHRRFRRRRVQDHGGRDGNEWVINGSKIFITNAASEMTLGVTVQAITGTRPNGKPEYTCFIRGERHPGIQGRAHEKEDDVAFLQYGGALFRRCARAGGEYPGPAG
jgi:short/branched chain acyl-CoA dehydrogenase